MRRKERHGNELTADFNRLAERYGRPLWPPFVSASQVDHHAIVRWRFAIDHMVVAWIDKYSRPDNKS